MSEALAAEQSVKRMVEGGPEETDSSTHSGDAQPLVIADQRPILAAAGVTSNVLAKYMTPLRAGDPLGLGFDRSHRPPPPTDPDVYDRDVEDKHYTRSTLSAEERVELDKTIEKEGFMSIEAVRKFISDNASATLTEVSGLDPEMIMLIDARTNYKIFVAGDNVYTREELFDHFPFHELTMQPEVVFTQQEIGIFPADTYSLHPDELSYVTRDAGDETVEFITIEDMVGLATRKNHVMKRKLVRAIKTKVYVGKEPWEDFKAMQQLLRGAVRMQRAHCANGSGVNIFAALMGAGVAPGPKLLTDPETLAAERLAREEEDARRAEELRIREEEVRRREEEVQRRIDVDIARLEKMFASKGLAAAAKTAAKTATKPVSAAAKPASAAAKLASVAAKPASVAAKPASVAAKPASVAAKPASVAAKPASVAAKPASAAAKPIPITAKSTTKVANSILKSTPHVVPDVNVDYSALFAEMFPDGDSVPL